jgi:hypothetical protein
MVCGALFFTSDTIESVLKNARTAQSAYRRSHPEDAAAMRSLVEARIGSGAGNDSFAMSASQAD